MPRGGGSSGRLKLFSTCSTLCITTVAWVELLLVSTHEIMRVEVCMFMRDKSLMLDNRGFALDELRVAEQDPRPK